MTTHSGMDQIRNGSLVSFSNKNNKHIFDYVSPDDFIKWYVRGTNDKVWTQIDSVSKIYKSDLLFGEPVLSHCSNTQPCLSDNIVVYFHLV